ncbi:tetratricopeptide repeat protein 5-like isoform X2 [Agrilus planipennis]|uniref:Tetratricopeptide repeat protein 5-like isoform X2 n=1 Tax=Agrilus planipennis TaxID=224129 RepID=A0A7F5RKY7_AGRPL|nr:tetratricopeptide repeat protein 5-like isoform X2 [Agrilus planipennis]
MNSTLNNEENDENNTANSKNNQETIESLTEIVDELYKFRDYYFEEHPLDNALEKKYAVIEHRARYFYLKGRALNVLPKYNKDAEDLLLKAVKLDPKLVEAWNELGECYWKKGNLKEAKNCFVGALNYTKNKISLRSLSMLARQEICNNKDEMLSNIEKGLTLAKEAVQMDPQDGLSWVVLGNAHLSAFFGISQNPKTLKLCLSAYSQAERDIIARSTPDLHYNKAITLKYEEEFLQALESFSLASNYDPTWEPPQQKKKELIKYLNNVSEMVKTSGKMKVKRLKQIVQSIDNKQLGPYSGGKYTSSGGQAVKLDEVLLSNLSVGLNEEKVMLGKVVCSIYNEDKVPFTFCMVDKQGECCAVTVFNIAETKGVIIGDSVAIPEPFITEIDFSFEENTFKFRLIRVETPCVLVVNGKKLGKEYQAGVQMSIFRKFD